MKEALNTKQIQEWLVAKVSERMQVTPGDLDLHQSFAHYGLSSKDVVTLSGELEDLLDRRLSPTLAYEYPSIAALAQYLGERKADKTEVNTGSDRHQLDEPIAIVGMSCRFPGAKDPQAFWRMLKAGEDKISEVPADRWPREAFYDPDPAVPGKAISYWGGFLENIDQFDPFFFGISPIEAKHMDPQQRLLMELSYEALEDAGFEKEGLDGTRTGVFIGVSVNEYGHFQFGDPAVITSHSGTGSALSIAANRISYFYNFRGPSMAIDTACSSSLTAVHQACQSLRNGESNLALAGGVNMILSPAHSIAFTKAGVLARDGRCKTFAANADGYVRGEGGGIIVLKRLSAALADGDHIHAVIQGSTMSQDGRTNGLMAPSQESQEAMLRRAYSDAGVAPESVQYVEAHGTGTLLGDAMEASALGTVLGAGREGNPCAIGSVKTNIGHLEAAAGIAGLMKVVLAMKHNTLPPSLHYSAPNPHVDFEALNLKVQNEAAEWPKTSGPATAGVSSFGFGGTNVHLIVSRQTAEEEKPTETSQSVLLPLSAEGEQSLLSLAESFYYLLTETTRESLNDLCYATGRKRAGSPYRLAVTGSSATELREGLVAFFNAEQHPNLTQGAADANMPHKTVFVFSGQGGQWLGMGRDLIEKEPVFRETIEQIDKEIQSRFNWSVLAELQADSSVSRLDDVAVIQPVIFAVQVGLAALWESWGIKPDGVSGHSMGEVAAAYVAGILTLEDAIQVICIRSQQLQSLKGKGAMLATELTKEQALEMLKGYEEEVSIAAINGPTATVLSGDPARLETVMKKLEAKNLFCRWVKVDVASHSPQIDSIAPEVLASLKNLSPQPAAIPFFSTVSASINLGLDMDAAYWVQNLRKPVLLSDTVSQLLEEGYNSFIELGPHPILLSSIQQSTPVDQNITMLPSMQRDTAGREVLLTSLARLYTQGLPVHWDQLYQGPHNYVSLPPGPWQRDRYWMDAPQNVAGVGWHHTQSSESKKHPLLGDKIDLAHAPTSHVWQNELSLDQLSYLEDHKVEGLIVFPATGYLEIAFQVIQELGLSKSHAIGDLHFQQLMSLTHDKPKSIQTFLAPEDSGNYELSIYSRESSKDRWTKHVAAKLRKTSSSELLRVKLPEDSADTINPDILYQAFESRGIQYGAGFQGIESLIREEGHVWGPIALPETLTYQGSGYQWHPALLDACLQVLGVVIEERGIEGLYVPSGCESIRVHADAADPVWSRVSLRDSAESSEGRLIADIHVFDGRGQLLIELTGFKLQSLQPGKSEKQSRKDTWLYQPKWRLSSISETSDSPEKKYWLILADDGGLGNDLADQLQAKGDSCQVLKIDSLNDAEAMMQRIEDCLKEAPSEIHGIIHLWSLSVADHLGTKTDPEEAIYSLGVDSTLCLVQALAKRFAGSPRLWLVTRGAQSVNNAETVALEQSTLWGLGKVISFELPEIKCVRVDLDPQLSNSEAQAQLLSQVAIDDDNDQVAFRGTDRFVMRLLPFQPQAHALANLSIRSEATYLITGGMGGLGLTTANWMAAQGAENFVLLGRSEPSPEAAEVIEKMLEAGANVIVAQADVTDREQIQEIFEKIKIHMPPLRGVIHAAGLLDDGSLLNLDRERMQKVMAPKVNGSWYLHEATAHLELDFFVLYSSAVSVLGSPGQGNYAAASAYLDAMAWYRQSLGLPALSINWGPWAEVGLAAETAERLKEQNASTQHLVKEIKIDQGLEVLELVMKESDPQVVVLPFDLKNLLELYPMAAGMSFFAEVGGSETHLTKLYARPKLEQAYVAPRTDVEKKLTELWEQTLHIDKVGIHDSFFELGGDSVLAAQILSLVRKTYGISISPQEAFKAFTIEQLAQQLEAEIMNQIMSMSDEEAERLLGEQN
ncbi:MAG: type I polyketide synthase [Roseivirga sp.]